jgi:integrase
MASIKKMVGKPRTDSKTGKVRPGVVSYKVRWYYPTEDGKAEEQTVTWRDFGKARTLKGIIEARNGRVRKTDPDVLDGSIVTGNKTRVDVSEKPFGLTVSQLITECLAQKAKDGVRQTTLQTYDSGHYRGTVEEFWGNEYVSQLNVPSAGSDDPADKARALLAYVTDVKGFNPRPVWKFTYSLLTYGVKKGYLSSNPMQLVKLPPQPKFEPRYLAQEEFELLLDCTRHDDLWLMLLTAWETGMRLGEICALRREDVTVINGRAYITVRHTVVRSKGRGLVLGLPKSGKNRVVVISVDLAERLLEPGRHEQQIFPAVQNPGKLLNPATMHKRFTGVRQRAQKGIASPDGKVRKLTGRLPRFHDLRHSHASNLLGQGVDMYVVSKRLGHSTIAITIDTYGHLGKKADEAVLAAICAHAVRQTPGSPPPTPLSVAA